uniref:Uncharacterized protein n=1 Tax=Myoviridae sp. ctshb19 TaxID=2825194 RepID=A0A8S5UH81_9CAUD|nr:MAG TPA: hypothetical protein [Myoviridae sp. ctshb19]
MVRIWKLTVFIPRILWYRVQLARVVMPVKTGVMVQTGVMVNRAQRVAKARQVHAVIQAPKVHGGHKVFKARQVQKANRGRVVLMVSCRYLSSLMIRVLPKDRW